MTEADLYHEDQAPGVSFSAELLALPFVEEPVERGQLVVLIDQEGSMVPFHRLTRRLARFVDEADERGLTRRDRYYFHNIPSEGLFTNPNLTRGVPYEEVLAGCSPSTGVLIVSDAGAARGGRLLQRIQLTTRFLMQIGAITRHLFWLNPMPSDRWPGSSAQIIAHRVRMAAIDPVEFTRAADEPDLAG